VSVVDRFDAFFRAVNCGASPYPWQRTLVERVAVTGRWPDIAAPTGSGKSSVIDAHVFLVAEHAAGRIEVRPPRRLVLVAPRRVLVDDQFERARRLAHLLQLSVRDAPGSPAGQVASELRRLFTSSASGDEECTPALGVWRLRGGVRLDNGWRLEPAACQILCATPQMWGSRLLLRGYGASRRARNLESGLLGHDTVAIIDEAHLHERLVETASRVSSQPSAPLGLQVVAMSATTRPSADTVGLTEADLGDPHLARRVQSVKEVDLVEVEDWRNEGVAEIIDRARARAGEGTVGVFVNDVPSALRVASELGEKGRRCVELVCGRLRLADVARLRARRPGLLTPDGDGDVEFLVTTQSLEVGVDLDLPAMVSAIAPASALAQRAGRLNRTGRRSSAPFVVVSPRGLDRDDETPSRDGLGPYDREEVVAGLAWLRGLDGTLSPQAVADSSLPLPARPPLPALRAPDLETLAITSEPLAADPDVALYIEDPQRQVPEVAIAARRYLDFQPEVVRAALIACPPRPHEVASMRLGKAFDRVIDAAIQEDVPPWLVRARGGELEAHLVSPDVHVEPGDTLVVPHGARVCTAGVVGIESGSGAIGPLDDVLVETDEGGPSTAIVPLPAAELEPIAQGDPVLGTRAARKAVASVLEAAGYVDLAHVLRHHRRLGDVELRWCQGEAEEGLLVVRHLDRAAEQTPVATADEPVTLDAHQSAVEERMRLVLQALNAEDLGIDPSTLVAAARLHDEGKRHPRFQRRMGANGVALAKPRPGHVPDRGDGWRHEQLSTAFAARASGGDGLLVTLVGGHHGCGRMTFDRGADDLLDAWSGADLEPWVEWLFGDAGRYELERSRAQRSLGVHRLAFLEALLRCADMQVSREGG